MEAKKPAGRRADMWGGLAAMLVALPSAIAFGVTIFAPLGAASAAQGAIAGMLGATVLGIVAAAFGGTQRLITAPCAPAAAVLSALALDLGKQGQAPGAALLLLALVGLSCGLLQVAFGLIGLGRLIKYMPYPVVSGYLSGVGVVIILSQLPKLLGLPKGVSLGEGLLAPSTWAWQGLAVGGVTMAVMVLAPRLTKLVPAAILGLGSGAVTYGALAAFDPALRALEHNALVVGALGGGEGGFLATLTERARGLGAIRAADLIALLTPAATLAVLLSIDTLKTCVVLDALTRSRHDSNRELIGQGLANVASSLLGGVPGAGQMGATLVNVSSGAETRLSGLLEGAFALVAFLLLGALIAWIPIGALAGILILVGLRMIDWRTLQRARSRATVLDCVVILSVVAVAVTTSLIAASAVGVGLAILLFLHEQVGSSIVRRRSLGNEMFSKRVRSPEEMAILEARGARTAIYELQGSLFFGTAHQLAALEPELQPRTYVVFDMRHVLSVDFTAAHSLEQLEEALHEREAYLIFSHFAQRVPSGRDLGRYFDQVGLVRPEHRVRVFEQRNEALEWIEDRLLEEERDERLAERPLELAEMNLFRGRKAETLAALEACMERRTYAQGQPIFARGEQGDELFLIRRGTVRIVLPLSGGKPYHLATVGRGSFFGEFAFLDGEPRSANALAHEEAELFVLSRARFDALAEAHKRLAMQLFEGLARTIAHRLRRADTELKALQEG